MVFWLVLVTEDRATNDTTDTSRADQGRGAKRTLPLTSDVVRLPGEDAGNVGVTGCRGNEDAKIANSDIVEIAKKRKALYTYRQHTVKTWWKSGRTYQSKVDTH